MRDGRRSRTAQYVALVRAILTDKGAIDDPYARGMLTPTMRLAAVVLPRLGRHTDGALYAALVGRTLAFDDAVRAAVDSGITQVVTIGAGYDSRPWRLARDGVVFYEVDHPATQADKRRRCPPAGPRFVPLDLTRTTAIEALRAEGFDWDAPALFLIEGVTMYLERDDAHALLRSVREACAPGSRLAVNFAAPDAPRQRTLAALGRVQGESFKSASAIDDPAAFVVATGWSVDEAVRLRERARVVNHPSIRADAVSPTASVVLARR